MPFTWDEMRARFAPTMLVEACQICSTLPVSSRSSEAWRQLESAGLPENPGSVWRYRCPSCHQLYVRSYQIPYDSADPYNLELTGESYELLERMPERIAFDEMIAHRVALDQFARALAALDPALDVDQREYRQLGVSFWRGYQLVRIYCVGHERWLLVSEQGELARCTLAEVARLSAKAPPTFHDVAVYADWVDHVTSSFDHQRVEDFERIPWRHEPSGADRTYIEVLRRASRVAPERVEPLVDRTLVHRWVVDNFRLICRVLTVWPTGVVEREDAVIGEAIPTYYSV